MAHSAHWAHAVQLFVFVILLCARLSGVVVFFLGGVGRGLVRLCVCPRVTFVGVGVVVAVVIVVVVVVVVVSALAGPWNALARVFNSLEVTRTIYFVLSGRE